MENLFVCYPKCSTCKKARDFLNANNADFKERDIKEDNPKAKELKKWIDKSGLPIKRFFNTSGIKYRELNLKEKLETMTDEEKIELLSTDGMLVKRPILITAEYVLVGFKEKDWQEKLSE